MSMLSALEFSRGICQLTHSSTSDVRLGHDIPMDRPRVPENKIARISADLQHFAATVKEPVDLVLLKAKPIGGTPRLATLDVVVSFEKELFKLAGSFDHDQPAVFRSVWRKVQDSLDALHALPQRALVDVRPWLRCRPVGCWDGQVHPVERHEELVGAP